MMDRRDVQASTHDSTPRAVVDVAVGVVLQPDGRFLLNSRPEGKPYAGYWEFPGGKLEAYETVEQALIRELREELALEVETASPWVTIEHVYPHAHVRLHFMRVTQWRGEPQACEGQQFAWFDVHDQRPEPLLPAAYPCLAWLALPAVILQSQLHHQGLDAWLVRLEIDLARYNAKALAFIEPAFDTPTFVQVFERVRARCASKGVAVIVDSTMNAAIRTQADGLWVSRKTLQHLTQRPTHAQVGACVATRAELERAAQLGMDYAVMEVDCAHPHMFAELAASTPLPLYACANTCNVEAAMQAGAHGLVLGVA